MTARLVAGNALRILVVFPLAAAALRALSSAPWPAPGIATALMLAVCGFAGCHALMATYDLFGSVDARRQGFGLRCIDHHTHFRLYGTMRGAALWYLYEERDPEGCVRGLPFLREVLTDGYPVSSALTLPGADDWDDAVPGWARGRRAEITARMARALGAEQGARIVIVDQRSARHDP